MSLRDGSVTMRNDDLLSVLDLFVEFDALSHLPVGQNTEQNQPKEQGIDVTERNLRLDILSRNGLRGDSTSQSKLPAQQNMVNKET